MALVGDTTGEWETERRSDIRSHSDRGATQDTLRGLLTSDAQGLFHADAELIVNLEEITRRLDTGTSPADLERQFTFGSLKQVEFVREWENKAAEINKNYLVARKTKQKTSSQVGALHNKEPPNQLQSWSEGFGEITLPWPSASFDASLRQSSTGTVKLWSSAMHDAARLKDWSRVLEICKQDPAAASYIGPGGMTALHHVCDKRCPDAEVAEAVIRACPDALTSESAKGWLPLHYAGRFKCQKGVVKALLDVDPEKGKVTVSKPDRQRRTPLFYAVRYDAPVGVVPQLLRADPSVVLSGDQNLQSPLEVIWNDFAEKIEGRRLLHPFIGDTQNTATPEDLQTLLQSPSNAELLKNWNTANIFLKAAFGFPLSEEEELADTSGRKWRILHATAAVDCHFTLFHMARALYPEQAQEMDVDDLYGPADNSD